MSNYSHKQSGSILISAITFALIIVAGALFLYPTEPSRSVLIAVVIILVVAITQFWSLSVRITETEIQVWYGNGLIKRSFEFPSIQGAQIVRNPWYYGWGIRFIPSGWMFNIAGLEAVELSIAGDRKFRIGTDDAQQLLAAIQNALSE